jgi:hypothetical protein
VKRRADCAHWASSHHEGDEHKRHICLLVSLNIVATFGGESPKAVTLDHAGESELLTAPDFGCVLWEAKT